MGQQHLTELELRIRITRARGTLQPLSSGRRIFLQTATKAVSIRHNHLRANVLELCRMQEPVEREAVISSNLATVAV